MSKHEKEKHWDREIKKEWRKERREKKSEKGWTNRKEGKNDERKSDDRK